MRFWKGSVCLFLGLAVIFLSAGQSVAQVRLFIRPWWPVPIILAPILAPGAFVPPAPQVQAPRPYFGSVDTNVSPKDAQVIVDGEHRGIANAFDGAPAFLELSPGRHKIEFQRDGYEPVALIVSIEPGEIVGIDLALKETREAAGPAAGKTYQLETEGTGYVELDATPADAAVYVDGSFFGIASQFQVAGHKIMLRAGNHTIEIGKPGYYVYKGNVTIVDKDTVKLSVSLEK